MAEISTEEHEKAVSEVYVAAMEALSAGRPITPEQRVVHDVEHMMQEVNSGASFEQYFRWAELDELRAIRGRLTLLGLGQVEALAAKAFSIAFPNGIPATEEEKQAATEWTEEQLEALGELFPQLEEYNGQVTNVLGAYAKRIKAA